MLKAQKDKLRNSGKLLKPNTRTIFYENYRSYET